ncbi:MAG: inositol monophosphatase family protein [Acetobacterales bacterium]
MAGAAQKAARGLIRDFGEVEQLQVSVKGPADFVSAADLRAERTLRAELSRARPAFGLLMEEQGETKGSDDANRWIVDPLDGTTNFLHGIPHFCISIAHESEGRIVAGVVYDPLRDETFWAEKGVGAYLNRNRLRVSGRKKLGEAVFATGIPFADMPDQDRFLRTLAAVMPATAGVRRQGSAALDLAYVAAGRYEAFWEYGLKPWDIAAGVLLVQEAGGFVSEIGGRPRQHGHVPENGDVLATNTDLHEPAQKLLKAAHTP